MQGHRCILVGTTSGTTSGQPLLCLAAIQPGQTLCLASCGPSLQPFPLVVCLHQGGCGGAPARRQHQPHLHADAAAVRGHPHRSARKPQQGYLLHACSRRAVLAAFGMPQSAIGQCEISPPSISRAFLHSPPPPYFCPPHLPNRERQGAQRRQRIRLPARCCKAPVAALPPGQAGEGRPLGSEPGGVPQQPIQGGGCGRCGKLVVGGGAGAGRGAAGEGGRGGVDRGG